MCAADEREPESRVGVAATSRGTSERAAGSVAAMPIPWNSPGDEEGPERPVGLDAGQDQDRQPMR